ncbi:ASST-domain-containing protein [Elsinoe ampelina]|uniref:ASST-domain-containing protein n=1 Tax=Elsinoe ampelina TaxID=302913 RepID=A0A6A6GPB5_9PEZI|nr:ASST-domain-containing protein [Elsinoe ampelina]
MHALIKSALVTLALLLPAAGAQITSLTPPPPWDIRTGPYSFSEYHTTDLPCPTIRSTYDCPACANGLFSFITPRGYSISSPSVAIYDDRSQLVWLKETDGQAYDLKVQEVEGRQYLTYWTGDDRVRGHGSGEWVVLDSSYEEQGRIGALNGLTADLHELVITPEGTALLTVYEARKVPSHAVEENERETVHIWDCLFQEIDPVRNTLIFQWRASDHYSISDTFHDQLDTGTADDPFDWFHINSVQKDVLGNYLISARYTHSITYIEGKTGRVLWILGGKRNYFKDLSGGAFPQTMHELVEDQSMMLHKRQKQLYPATRDSSLNTQERSGLSPDRDYTARLVRTYVHTENISSSSQGSMQLIESPTLGEDPTVLIGYGFNATGDVQSYRTFQNRWIGRPNTDPTITLSANCSEDAIFVSWNGATEVRQWLLQTSMNPDGQHWLRRTWRDIISVERESFETRIDFDGRIAKHLPKQAAVTAIHTHKLFIFTNIVIPCLALLAVVGCFLTSCIRLFKRGQYQNGPLLRAY